MADARVEEDDGAVLAFAVTLSPAASGTLTVDYATADGSALAAAPNFPSTRSTPARRRWPPTSPNGPNAEAIRGSWEPTHG